MPSTITSHENGFPKRDTAIHYPDAPITDIFGNGFFIVNRQWMVSSWNQMAANILGISSTDIAGKNLWIQFMDAIPDTFYTAYNRVSLQDVPVNFTIYWPEKMTWFEVTTCHFNDSLSVSFKISQNPEEPLRSPQHLQSLNDMYRLITEVTTDCLWEWDHLTQQILWIDGGHKRAFGYEIVNALIPQGFWETKLHPDDKARILASIDHFFRDGVADEWEAEYRFRKFDGEYAYVHDRGHLIYNHDERTSRMIGATRDITDRKSAESKLLKSERNLVQQQLKNQKQIIAAVLVAQEKERSSIGKELHDNLNQILGASKLYIELAKTDDENREMLLEKSAGFIVTVIEEIRDISKNLAAPRLNVMGLSECIKILVEDIMVISPMQIRFQEDDSYLDSLSETLQLDIFRIVQEQLNNIQKHAKASQAEIQLVKKNNTIELTISDNGVGCDTTTNHNGIGIMNIISRAEIYQGTVSIRSRPGEGYVLKVTFNELNIDRTAVLIPSR